MLRKYLVLAILALLSVIAADEVSSIFKSSIDHLSIAEDFAKQLDEKTQKATREIYSIQTSVRRDGIPKTQVVQSEAFTKLYREEGISIAVFRNDELVLWTSNVISPISLLRAAAAGTSIKKFENGWYRLIYLTDGIDEYCAAVLIKHTFPYQNKYLENGFRESFAHPSLQNISTQPETGSVKLKAGDQSFYLIFQDPEPSTRLRSVLFFILAFGGGIALLFSLYKISDHLYSINPRFYIPLLFLGSIIGFRYLSIITGWPSYLESLDFFSPKIYASSLYYASIADFAINSSLIFVVALSFQHRFTFKGNLENRKLSLGLLTVLVFALFAFGAYVNHLTKGLVLNSNIPFEVDNILGLDKFSFIAIMASGLLYYSFFALSKAIFKFRASLNLDSSFFYLLIAIVSLGYILITHWAGIRDLYFVLWPPLLFCLLLLFENSQKKDSQPLSLVILGIGFFAVVASHNFIKYSAAREHAERQVLVDKIAVDDDPIAEILYGEVIEALSRDQDVKEVFYENELHTRKTMEDFVLSRYFTGYWSKYDITLYAFLSDSSVWGKLPAVRPRTFNEIQKAIKEHGQRSLLHESLYYMYNTEDLVTYMAILPLDYSLAQDPDGYLVFEFSSQLFPRQLGFPSLLIDEGSNNFLDNGSYSTARYVKSRLIRSRGEYPYQAHPGSLVVDEGERAYIVQRGYEHLTAQIDEATGIVISKPLKSPLDKATTFSYLCALFGLLYITGLTIKNLIVNRSPFELNLNQKVQALLVGLTIAGLLFFALATRYYIEKKYTEKNTRQISEKMQSVLLELQSKLGEEEALIYDMSDLLNRMLSQFSYIFFTDINIYDPDGNLLASSQMRMFNEGLVSRRMHPRSFAYLKYLDQVEYLHDEEIGEMSYISGYVPFYNDRGVLLAYLNLPYFAKQSELDDEISSFLVSVINIFVVLFLFAILVGLFMAQWITAPLRSIREGLAGVELGKSNKPITYKGTDEIGLLVSEYNSKVAELENNAERLAQSERESAWREMAKQVAHEIKNPLTPMKLSVQHLERSIDSGKEISTDQIKRLTTSLVEQIDGLSSIARAFSDFARMPQAKSSPVDLSAIIEQTVALYSGMEKVELSYENHAPEAMVLGDKDQLIRVFNNLIKNAKQATEEIDEGKIKIVLEKSEVGFRVCVSDNGTGIDPSVEHKIFVPNFTTKSRGMGLGLAICKNIVEQVGGKIWFENTIGGGTSFYVELPSIK
jgi:signal transduction histidine kinase